MRTLDRYVIREVVSPFLIGLLVFTFVLIIPFIIELAETLIAKGVPWQTLLLLMATLLPQALGLTIPMALLIALLVAFGRLSGDREIVAMMACGVSPFRLMRPLSVVALITWAATSWVLLYAIPDANQAYREITMRLVADRAEGEVRPRVFFEDFPNMVLYVGDVPPTGGWVDVMAADTRDPGQPILYLAKRGRMLVSREERTIQMVLEDGTRHTTRPDNPTNYEVVRYESILVSLDPESVFPRNGPARGDRELTIAELQQRADELVRNNDSPHNPLMEIHKKFSIPAACWVFTLIGLALGATNRRDGKLASFVLGIGVILVYYVLMYLGQSLAKGHVLSPWLAMWLPNLVLGAVGAFLLYRRAYSADQPIRISLPARRVPAWLAARLRRLTPPQVEGAARSPGAPALAAGSADPERIVVVLRVPEINLPRPGLLDLYVAGVYLRVLALAVAGMAGLFYISTFIDLSDKLFKGTATIWMLLEYFWWATPQFLYYIVAIAVLLAALVTIGILTKNSELIVMRACGVSLYRTAVPLLACALVASAVLFALEDRVMAGANRRADALRHVIRGGSPQTFDVLNRKWLVGRDGTVYHYQFYDPRRQELNGLSVFRVDAGSGSVIRRAYARVATYDPALAGAGQPAWTADAGWIRDFTRDGDVARFQPFEKLRFPFEPAEYFVTEAPEPRRMNFAQLRKYVDELRGSGYDVRKYQVDLQRKLAFPFVTLIMTLIAVPFAVTTGRRGAMYGIGIGIVIALVYWTLISVFAAFGAGGLMSPTLAAWAPNLLFGAAAIYMLLTVRT
jgi:LPS export ABC transporter permease LptF/LPS export ABC transporter permease LptG